MANAAGGGGGGRRNSIPQHLKNFDNRLERNLDYLNKELKKDFRGGGPKSNMTNDIITGVTAASQGRRSPVKKYGGMGKANSSNPRGVDQTAASKRGKPKPKAAPTMGKANAPERYGSGAKPAPKPAAAPKPVRIANTMGGGRGGTTAPRVAGTSTSPAIPTVNGQPVGKNNPLPAPKTGGQQAAPSSKDYWKDFYDRASSSVNAADLPALNEIKRMMEETTSRGNRASSEISERGQREQTNLNEIYNRLSNFQGGLQDVQRENFGGLQKQAGTAYDQLAASLNQTFDGAQAKAQSEVDRLGLGHAVDPNIASERDQSFLTGLAGVDKAALQGGLGQMHAGFDSLMGLSRANAGTESFSRQAQSMRETNRSLEQIQFELENEIRNLSGKSLDIHSTSGQRIRELAEAFEEKKYAREMEARQQQFQNDMATKQFGLQEQQVKASLMPQPMAPPSEYEQLQAAELAQRIQANQALQEAQLAQIRAPERNQVQPIPAWQQRYPSPNAVDNYGKYR